MMVKKMLSLGGPTLKNYSQAQSGFKLSNGKRFHISKGLTTILNKVKITSLVPVNIFHGRDSQTLSGIILVH